MKVKEPYKIFEPFYRKHNKTISIKVDKVDITEDEFIELFSEGVNNAVIDVSNNIFDDFISKRKQLYKKYSNDVKKFNKRLYKRWEEPLNLLELFIYLSLEFGNKMKLEIFPTLKDNDFLPFTIIKLHAKACQISGEILTLLKHGYSDGAMSRWRSLYETVIILFFIEKFGSKTAEKYLHYEVIESCKAIDDYQKYCERFEMEPFTKRNVDEIKDIRNKLCNKYGINFRENYGWASNELGVKRPNFRMLEDAVDFRHYRPWYRMASYHVHTSPKSMIFSLGVDPSKVILAGPSNMGLTDPAQNLVISLNHINASLLSLDVDKDTKYESIIFSRFMFSLAKKIQEILFEIDKSFARDDFTN